jgi:hypothetical protein
MYAIIALLFILSKPISWILDKILGKELGMLLTKD